jgi:DNA helicase-2/ATP-dependent DNA helicase PcrA
MNRIYITNAEIRRNFGEIRYQMPSRFIHEIPEELLKSVEYLTEGFTSTIERRDYMVTKPDNHRAEVHREIPEAANSTGSRFRIRDVVMHPKYGTGIITNIKGSGDNIKLSISFNKGESKSFMEKYTHLEKIV